MKKFLTVALAIVALAIGHLEASAQMGTSNGTIVSSTPTAIVIRTDDGTNRTYTVNSSSIMPAASLRVGDRIALDYNTLTAGDMVVTRVTVVPGAAVTTTTTSPGYSTSGNTTTNSTTSTTTGSNTTYGSTNGATTGSNTTYGSTTGATTGSNTTYGSTSSTNDTYPDTAANDVLPLLLGGIGLAGAATLRILKRS
ncbi:MAG TPA: hypothetical protein VF720_07465 [Candidatus Eisenbacteria bacterium]